MTIIKHKRDVSSEWTLNDPILADGEIGIERDTNQFKMGNGTSLWSELEYFYPGMIIGPTGPQGDTGATGATGPPSYELVITNATAGAAVALDASIDGSGNVKTTYALTLTAATCTLTVTGVPAGKACGFTLVLKQDGVGGRLVAWPANTKWDSGAAPTLSTGAGKVDVVSLLTVDDGASWLGFLSGQDMR